MTITKRRGIPGLGRLFKMAENLQISYLKTVQSARECYHDLVSLALHRPSLLRNCPQFCLLESRVKLEKKWRRLSMNYDSLCFPHKSGPSITNILPKVLAAVHNILWELDYSELAVRLESSTLILLVKNFFTSASPRTTSFNDFWDFLRALRV